MIIIKLNCLKFNTWYILSIFLIQAIICIKLKFPLNTIQTELFMKKFSSKGLNLILICPVL